MAFSGHLNSVHNMESITLLNEERAVWVNGHCVGGKAHVLTVLFSFFLLFCFFFPLFVDVDATYVSSRSLCHHEEHD